MASAMVSDENIDEISEQMVASMEESTKEDRRKITEYLKENGVTGYGKYLQERLEDWKTCPLRIAVAGSSGQGNHSVCFN